MLVHTVCGARAHSYRLPGAHSAHLDNQAAQAVKRYKEYEDYHIVWLLPSIYQSLNEEPNPLLCCCGPDDTKLLDRHLCSTVTVNSGLACI
jgi:hypothetical protein